MNRIYAFSFFILISAWCYGHGVISGKVITSSREQAIPNALISISPSEKFTYSDDRGAFRFGDLTAGTYTLSIYLGDEWHDYDERIDYISFTLDKKNTLPLKANTSTVDIGPLQIDAKWVLNAN